MASETEKYLEIGNTRLLLAKRLPRLHMYDPGNKPNEITATGLSALRLDGRAASPSELGALLEMNVLMTLHSYKESELGRPLEALRSELGGRELLEDEASGIRLRERQELDVTLMDEKIRYICRCQVKHRSARAGSDEVSALVDKFRSLTLEMILSGRIPDYGWIKKADLYFIASAGDPGIDEISVHPGARYRIDLSYPYQQKIKGLNPLPARSKILWLDDTRLESRYWGRKKGRRTAGDPEIFLPGAEPGRQLYLDMTREIRQLSALETRSDPGRKPAIGQDIMNQILYYADCLFDTDNFQIKKVQREWARLTHSRIMRLIDLQDDLILRKYIGDYTGIIKADFEQALSKLEGLAGSASRRSYEDINSLMLNLESAMPNLSNTSGEGFGSARAIGRGAADSMIQALENLIKPLYLRFERDAIERGLMPYSDDKLRLRIIEGENFVYGPPGLYVTR